MKILANQKIKSLFLVVGLCILLFTLISTFLILFNAKHAAIGVGICAIGAFVTILIALRRYFQEQSHIIEEAERQITEYISGNKDARIECDDEGELYKLFHKVNSLTAIFNAHLDNEGKAKAFLKNTISDISHQLKTPLAALNIYNGIIQSETVDSPEIQGFTSLTEQELDRIEILVQNLLKITRLDAGAITMDKTEENLAEIVKTTEKHFAYRAKTEKKQMLLTGKEDITLLCDKYWLTQAIDNIVKNALDHTAEGGTIHITYKKFASMVQIVIKDNGSGIHPEDLPHIFKRFYRSRFSTDTQGVGLGLPLAKTIIDAHNGSIEVDSEVNRGTTFTVTFLT